MTATITFTQAELNELRLAVKARLGVLSMGNNSFGTLAEVNLKVAKGRWRAHNKAKVPLTVEGN